MDDKLKTLIGRACDEIERQPFISEEMDMIYVLLCTHIVRNNNTEQGRVMTDRFCNNLIDGDSGTVIRRD